MHAIANSPTPLYSSSGRANEVSAAPLPPPMQPPSLNSSSTCSIPIDKLCRAESNAPQFPWVDGWSRGSNGIPSLRFSAAKSTDFNFKFVYRGFDVTQLPVEIICEIFEKFVDDDLLQPIRGDPSLPLVSHTCWSDPTKLGQICSRWRVVAINLPKLWSNILIYNPKLSQVYLTDVWLKRSGNNPLSLEINYDGENHRYDLRSAAQILQSFIAHLGRWKKFHLKMSIQLLGPLYAIVNSPHKPQILESVDLDFHVSRNNHVQINALDAIWKYFHGCPTLRRVVWHGNEVSSFPKHAPSQLTCVHSHFPVSIDDILTFLPQVPFIQELQIEDLSIRNPPIATAPPLLLQHLRSLRICSRRIPAISCIAGLTCPSLESLEIIHIIFMGYSDQDLQEIPRFLQRSGCRLQRLDLHDNDTDSALERCLSASPLQSLKSFHLGSRHIYDRIVALLSRKSSAGLHEFAPFLENLCLSGCEVSDGLLASMVSSRWYEILDENHSTPLGHLRKARIEARNRFGPVDEVFFSSNILY